MKDLRDLETMATFLEYAYLALCEHFPSHDDFDNYFDAIKTDEMRNLFLRTASFYLFLVKRGDWVVDVPSSNKVIDYFTDSYRFVMIFSLIESLRSEEKFIDFYSFLVRKKSGIQFPIDEKKLGEHYSRYKDEFGSVRHCIAFLKALPSDTRNELISKLKVRGTASTIENLAKSLYEMRSKFVHEGKLVLHMSEGMSIGYQRGKLMVCNLSIKDFMRCFEEGLLAHFKTC